jgi:hypothetical protein
MKYKKGYIYSIKKNKNNIDKFLKYLFPEKCQIFIENPKNPKEFGCNEINDSINFPGFAFDSTKEARWIIKESTFHITIISDKEIEGLSEEEGEWKRQKISENKELSGLFPAKPHKEKHLNIKSKWLITYLDENKILENAEVFSRDSIPIFVTMRS